MTRENSGWGYDRIAGALRNLGHPVFPPSRPSIIEHYHFERPIKAKAIGGSSLPLFTRYHEMLLA